MADPVNNTPATRALDESGSESGSEEEDERPIRSRCCEDRKTCTHGFLTPIKRIPYPPYSGRNLAEVVASFEEQHPGFEVIKTDPRLQEFHRLLRYVRGKE